MWFYSLQLELHVSDPEDVISALYQQSIAKVLLKNQCMIPKL